MKLKTYNPQIFQGNLKKKNYFEGWYFKQVSQNAEHVYSFIPGVSLAGEKSHSFIQVINGVTGKTDYIPYDLKQFEWEAKRFYVKVGNSVFTENYIQLDINTEGLKVSGRLEYSGLTKYPASLFSPGIMGWYSFIPFMECKHGIVSVNHKVSGSISVNDELISFDEGKGYIEKDWGSSFPEAWIWMQANNFSDPGTSFNFSVAKIPWLGKFFVGFISFLYYNNKYYLYSTYNNSVIIELNHSEKSLEIKLKNKNSVLKVSATKKTFGELMAPSSGDMSRRIKESVDSEIALELFDLQGKLIYSDSSNRAGLEVIEKIFEYLDL